METILLLHGALGSSHQLRPLAHGLSKNYNVHTFNFTGHGGSGDINVPFAIEQFATDVLQYLETESLDKVSIFGYSMGGYVGLYIAKHHPEKINEIIALASKYHWDPATAEKEIKMVDPVKIEQKIPAFATALRERHHPHDWKVVLQRTADMMQELGNNTPLKSEDFAAIQAPALLLLGDRDKMTTLEETTAVYKMLPKAMMAMLPGTAHPIEQVDTAMLAYMIGRFLERV